MYPTYGPQSRDPLLFVAFDQHIDPEAVLATITASAGGQTVPLRMATQDEVAADARRERLQPVCGRGALAGV